MPKPKALARVLNDTAPAVLDGPSNERQALFVKYYAETGANGADAAKLAGYADPPQSAYRLLTLPHIRAAIRARRETLINGDLAKQALATLGELMMPGTPAPVRLGASRTALEMAGHFNAAKQADALADKPLGEMTVAELEKFISEGQDALARVKIIPGKVIPPNDAPNSAPVPRN